MRSGMALASHDINRSNLLPCRSKTFVLERNMGAEGRALTIKRGLEGVVVPSKLYSTLAAGIDSFSPVCYTLFYE